jgi:hypothetical protein
LWLRQVFWRSAQQGAAIPCFQVLPDESDRFVLTAILTQAGAQVATAFKFRSGPDDFGTFEGDDNILMVAATLR